MSSAFVAFRQIICRVEEPHLADTSKDIPRQKTTTKESLTSLLSKLEDGNPNRPRAPQQEGSV
ncbi:MAG: hypothetical protein ACK5EO_12105 [Planctomycetota bacterium]